MDGTGVKMELPPTLLYRYLDEKLRAMKEWVVIINGRIYTVGSAGAGTGRTETSRNFIRFNDGGVSSMEEGPHLLDLEESYLRDHRPDVDSYIASSLDSILDEKKNKLLARQGSILKLGDNVRFARMVIDQIIPNFDRNHFMYKKKKSLTPAKIASYKAGIIGKLFEDDRIRNADPMVNLGQVIGGIFEGNTLLHENCRGSLKETMNNGAGSGVYFNGVRYQPLKKEEFNLEAMDEAYRRKIIERIKERIINKDNPFARELDELAGQEEILGLLGRNKYLDSAKKVGFVIADGRFHVCAEIEDDYILYDPKNRKYYGFGPRFGKEPALIAVGIARDNGNKKVISIEKPIVLNSYKHPALPSDSANQEICTGDYEKTRPKYSEENNLPTTLLSILYETISSFTGGYSGLKEHKKFHDHEKYWDSHLLKPNQVEKSLVTNMDFVNAM